MNRITLDNIDPKTTCCFTGHRPGKLRNGSLAIRKQLRKAILGSIAEGYDTFISGMAPGVDTLAAQEVLTIKLSGKPINLICAVPFPGVEKNRHPVLQSLFKQILEASDGVEYVCPKYKPWCFTARDKWMVEHVSKVIAVYNGTKGGTEFTVNYAKKLGRQIVLIDDSEDLNNLPMTKNNLDIQQPITKSEWDELFEHLTNEMAEEAFDNGDSVFTVEGFHKWMDAIINMPNYPDDGDNIDAGSMRNEDGE